MAETSARRLRRFRRALVLTWSAVWIAGLGVLSAVALGLRDQLRSERLDAQLELCAQWVYGLAFFDREGRFHDDLLRAEGVEEGLCDVRVISPGSPPIDHLREAADRSPRTADLLLPRDRVLATEEALFWDGQDRDGRKFRVYAMPTYTDGTNRLAAAVIAVADPKPSDDAYRSFATGLVSAAFLLGLAGLAAGVYLTRWSLKPIAAWLEERERFLRMAAHELRTPIAALRGLLEVSPPREGALERARELAGDTSRVVEDLLLLARLDAGSRPLETTRARLDLLVENQLPENGSVALEVAGGEVDAEVDPRLFGVAVRNLVDNALRHGSGPAGVKVTVAADHVRVKDRGRGFPESLLERATEPFSFSPSTSGTGLGLAIVRHVAELHGGRLRLENRPEGGASAEIRLAPARSKAGAA